MLALDRFDSFGDLLARCSRSHREQLRQKERRLAQHGAVSLRIADAAEAGAAMFDALACAYEARREQRPEYPPLERPGLADLWRRAATVGVAEGWGHLSALLVDGREIAWHLGLWDRDQLYWWVPAHDPAWQACSPGRLLLARLVDEGIRRRWRTLHFLTGAQRYKLSWRPDVADRRVVRWHAPTMTGSLLAQYDRAAARV